MPLSTKLKCWYLSLVIASIGRKSILNLHNECECGLMQMCCDVDFYVSARVCLSSNTCHKRMNLLNCISAKAERHTDAQKASTISHFSDKKMGTQIHISGVIGSRVRPLVFGGHCRTIDVSHVGFYPKTKPSFWLQAVWFVARILTRCLMSFL